ncbi:MAG: hypothetical protein ABIQ40_17060 [Bacteroidia bacterium]
MKTYQKIVLRFKDQDAFPPIKSIASRWLRNRAVVFPLSQWDILLCCLEAFDKKTSALLKKISSGGDNSFQLELTELKLITKTISTARIDLSKGWDIQKHCSSSAANFAYDNAEYELMLLNLHDFFIALEDEDDHFLGVFYEK